MNISHTRSKQFTHRYLTCLPCMPFISHVTHPICHTSRMSHISRPMHAHLAHPPHLNQREGEQAASQSRVHLTHSPNIPPNKAGNTPSFLLANNTPDQAAYRTKHLRQATLPTMWLRCSGPGTKRRSRIHHQVSRTTEAAQGDGTLIGKRGLYRERQLQKVELSTRINLPHLHICI